MAAHSVSQQPEVLGVDSSGIFATLVDLIVSPEGGLRGTDPCCVGITANEYSC